mgnify:CR=1 FL=1
MEFSWNLILVFFLIIICIAGIVVSLYFGITDGNHEYKAPFNNLPVKDNDNNSRNKVV